jgi:hypothetical protein
VMLRFVVSALRTGKEILERMVVALIVGLGIMSVAHESHHR